MRTRQPLPTPSPKALQHSDQLKKLIVQEIEQAGGSIPFRQFMQMALYQPGFGYYVAGQEKFGATGDFITAPEISPLFAHCIANHCVTLFSQIKKENHTDSVLELGAGSGIMAADILQRLSALHALPQQYLILEPGEELRQRQRNTLQTNCPQLLDRVKWLQTLPDKPIQGIILANEVMDAMPVELFQVANTGLYNVQTIHKAGELYLEPAKASEEQTESVRQACINTWDHYHDAYRPQQPYQSEYNPLLHSWIKSLGETLLKGEILLIDYGYERSDYYRPERNQGTLLCYYRHRVHDQPLLWPGLQDITCSVDFTAAAEAAENAGLDIATYQTQADFLFNSGLESLFNAALEAHPEKQYQLAQQVRTLTLPAEMGERFKVMTLTKGFTPANQHNTLSALHSSDRRHRL